MDFANLHRVVLHFSGVYQDFLEEGEYEFLDLRALEGTNGYLSQEAAEKIRDCLAHFPAEGVHLLDSGNYHYASLFWLEKIGTPYDLLVFDHHTDLQPSAWGDDLVSCGSWIRRALQSDPNLNRVYLAGPEAGREAEIREWVDAGRLIICSEAELKDLPGRMKEEAGGGLPLYLSIDKDILAGDQVRTNWDQGDLSLSDLILGIEAACQDRRLIGADICGEPAPDAGTAAIRQSMEVNRRLISQVLSLQKRNHLL